MLTSLVIISFICQVTIFRRMGPIYDLILGRRLREVTLTHLGRSFIRSPLASLLKWIPFWDQVAVWEMGYHVTNLYNTCSLCSGALEGFALFIVTFSREHFCILFSRCMMSSLFIMPYGCLENVFSTHHFSRVIGLLVGIHRPFGFSSTFDLDHWWKYNFSH